MKMNNYIVLIQTSHLVSCSKKDLNKLLSDVKKDKQVTTVIAIKDLREEINEN